MATGIQQDESEERSREVSLRSAKGLRCGGGNYVPLRRRLPLNTLSKPSLISYTILVPSTRDCRLSRIWLAFILIYATVISRWSPNDDAIPSRCQYLPPQLLSPNSSLPKHTHHDQILIATKGQHKIEITEPFQTSSESSSHNQPSRHFSNRWPGAATKREERALCHIDFEDLSPRQRDMSEIPHGQGTRGRASDGRSGEVSERRAYRDASKYYHSQCSSASGW